MGNASAMQRLFAYTLITLTLLCATLPPAAYAHDTMGKKLFVIKQNGLYGYMDETAQVVISPQYLYAKDFAEGIAPVFSTDRQWLLINEKGEQLRTLWGIDGVEPFAEGLAGFSVKAKYGFIDRTGKVVIPARYDWAYRFSDGLACVGYRQNITPQNRLGTFIFGYIDKSGKLAIELQFKEAADFSEGLAAVIPQTSNRWGYIDKTGKLVFEPQFFSAGSFRNGLASVSRDGDYTGFIDKAGTQWILGPRYNSADCFSEGLAPVLVNRLIQKNPFAVIDPGKWGFVNTAGKMVIEPRFNYASPFKNGLARIEDRPYYDLWAAQDGKTTENRIGYIDKAGKFVRPLTN